MTAAQAEAGFNLHLRTELDELGGTLRCQGRSRFTRMRFFRNGNLHLSKKSGEIITISSRCAN
jgi:hypothetical protein